MVWEVANISPILDLAELVSEGSPGSMALRVDLQCTDTGESAVIIALGNPNAAFRRFKLYEVSVPSTFQPTLCEVAEVTNGIQPSGSGSDYYKYVAGQIHLQIEQYCLEHA